MVNTMELDGSKRIIDLTLAELDQYLVENGFKKPAKKERDSIDEYEEGELLFGLKELAAYLKLSLMTIQSMKDRGDFEGAYFRPSPRKFIFIKEKIDKISLTRVRPIPDNEIHAAD